MRRARSLHDFDAVSAGPGRLAPPRSDRRRDRGAGEVDDEVIAVEQSHFADEIFTHMEAAAGFARGSRGARNDDHAHGQILVPGAGQMFTEQRLSGGVVGFA